MFSQQTAVRESIGSGGRSKAARQQHDNSGGQSGIWINMAAILKSDEKSNHFLASSNTSWPPVPIRSIVLMVQQSEGHRSGSGSSTKSTVQEEKMRKMRGIDKYK